MNKLRRVAFALVILGSVEIGADAPRTIDNLMQQARTEEERGETATAEALYQEAWLAANGMACMESEDDLLRERCWTALNALTNLTLQQAKLDAADRWSTLATEMGETVNPPLGALLSLRGRMELQRLRSKVEDLDTLMNRAEELARTADEGAEEAGSWALVGAVALAGGFNGRAVVALDRAGTGLQELGATAELAQIHLLLAATYAQLLAFDQARLYVDRILEQPAGLDPETLSMAQALLALLSQTEGAPPVAGNPNRRAGGAVDDFLTLVQEAQDALEQIVIGSASQLTLTEVKDWLSRRLPNLGDAKLKGLDFEALMAAIALEEAGKPAQAALTLERAVVSPPATGEEPWAILTYQGATRLYRQAGNLRRAIELTEQVLNGCEQRWEKAEDDAIRRTLLVGCESDYRLLVQLLIEDDQPSSAFFATERARGRALLTLLSEEGTVRQGAHPGLLQKLSQVRFQLSSAEAVLEKTGAEPDRLALLWRQYEELLIRLRLSRDISPARGRGHRFPPSISVQELQEALPGDASLVSFYATERQVFAWVFHSDNFTLVETGFSRDDLDQIAKFRQAILAEAGAETDRAAGPVSSPSGSSERKRHTEERIRLGSDIYRKLMDPVLPHLRGDRLFLVPSEELHYLPFAALQKPSSGRFLVEDYTLSLLPSASVLPLLVGSRGLATGGRAVVLGDPIPSNLALGDLAGSRQEATRVAALWRVEPYLGARATEGELRRSAASASLIHVAAHGIYRQEHPLFSYLALTPDAEHDGRLKMTEVFEDLKLSGSPLVVLSACETALGERSGGDEIVGLVRAFLASGASSVVATQWKIEDDSSAELMIEFYRQLQKGSFAADALARAQRKALGRVETNEPYFWAAYGITGGFGSPLQSPPRPQP